MKALNSFDFTSRSLVFRSGHQLIPTANAAYPQLLWVFLLGPAPFLVAVFGLLSDETQIWLGDLRVVWCGASVSFVCLIRMWIAAPYMATVSCTYSFCKLASLFFRTEPRATSAKQEKKVLPSYLADALRLR